MGSFPASLSWSTLPVKSGRSARKVVIGKPTPFMQQSSWEGPKALRALRCRQCELVIAEYGSYGYEGQSAASDQSLSEDRPSSQFLQPIEGVEGDISLCPKCREQMERGVLLASVGPGITNIPRPSWKWLPPGSKSHFLHHGSETIGEPASIFMMRFDMLVKGYRCKSCGLLVLMFRPGGRRLS